MNLLALFQPVSGLTSSLWVITPQQHPSTPILSNVPSPLPPQSCLLRLECFPHSGSGTHTSSVHFPGPFLSNTVTKLHLCSSEYSLPPFPHPTQGDLGHLMSTQALQSPAHSKHLVNTRWLTKHRNLIMNKNSGRLPWTLFQVCPTAAPSWRMPSVSKRRHCLPNLVTTLLTASPMLA